MKKAIICFVLIFWTSTALAQEPVVYLPLILKYASTPFNRLDDDEREWYNSTQYPDDAEMMYLENEYIKVGISPSYGGTLFWLSKPNGPNLIKEHGGAAVQLSLWGYDLDMPGGPPCNPDSWGDRPIPHNPIMAQAENCGWDGPTNDVNSVYWAGDELIFEKSDPWQFTKYDNLPGLTWSVGVTLPPESRFVELRYRVDYDNPNLDLSIHNQEIPAIFVDDHVGHHYYYEDIAGGIVRVEPMTVTAVMTLPSRSGIMPLPEPDVSFQSGGNWLTACSEDDTECLTVATDAPQVKSIVLGGPYVTALGRFALGTEYHEEWIVRLAPK